MNDYRQVIRSYLERERMTIYKLAQEVVDGTDEPVATAHARITRYLEKIPFPWTAIAQMLNAAGYEIIIKKKEGSKT